MAYQCISEELNARNTTLDTGTSLIQTLIGFNLFPVFPAMKSAIGLFTLVVTHFRSREIHLGGNLLYISCACFLVE